MFEKLGKTKKLEKARKMFTNAVDKDTSWQNEAREDFDFRDGKQWKDEEKDILEEELRPVLTFNLTKAGIDVVMGINEDNKIIHRASPMERSDSFLCEVLNDLSDYVKETNEFEEEEDSALESTCICGRGWVGIDFQPDPQRFGNIVVSEVDIPVHEVHYDPASRRPNLEDASYLVWDRWITKEDFRMRFPKLSAKKVDDLAEGKQQSLTGAGDPLSEDGIPISDPTEYDYEREVADNDFAFFDYHENMVRFVHMEYWEAYRRYYVFNPEVGDFVELPKAPSAEEKARFLEEFGEEMTVEVMYDKRVKWLQFTGDDILYDDVSPLPYPGFSVVPTFGYRDMSKRTKNHFGIVRLIKDPQREVNKRWSQALNMLNQQVQPGVYAETDAFVDERQAQQSMKVSGDITWVNAGSLTGGKIKERTVPDFPNAPMQMEQFSQDIMKKITGINPDLMGQDRGRQESGVVVRLRQQQGITLLKPLFKNYNYMKKELFKRQLAIIMSYMPDRQVIKILGQNGRYTIDEQGVITDLMSEKVDEESGEVYYTRQAELRDVRSLEYNVKAEQAPGNLSKRMLELQVYMEMQDRLPIPPEQIINKLEISATEKEHWLEYIQKQQEAEAQKQEKMEQLEIQFKDREIRNDEQATANEFIVDIAKIKQMSEKDEKAMVTKFKGMDQQEQSSILQFAANMMTMVAAQDDGDKAESALEIDKAKAAQDIIQDGQTHTQDIVQDEETHAQDMAQAEAKHQQQMRFIEEKNALLLKAAEDKAEQDIKLAKQKAKEGGDKSGKGKQTADAKS